MSWCNLEQLTLYGDISKSDIWVEDTKKKPKELWDATRTKVIRTLEWHISINLFFINEIEVNRISQIKIWKFIRSNYPTWFTCVNPGNSVDKIWVLKNEFISQAKVILGEYKVKYSDTLWKFY